jgi:predicted ATPase
MIYTVRIPTIVLTGGPMAGKTTTLQAIHHRFAERVCLVPEAATQLFAAGHPLPGRDCIWSDSWQDTFQMEVLKLQWQQEAEALIRAKKAGATLIITDRGTMDGAAYVSGGIPEFEKRYSVKMSDEYARYKNVFHLQSVACFQPDQFGTANNATRYETSVTQALEREMATREAWQLHPEWQMIPGNGGIEAVISQVLICIAAEIEKTLAAS